VVRALVVILVHALPLLPLQALPRRQMIPRLCPHRHRRRRRLNPAVKGTDLAQNLVLSHRLRPVQIHLAQTPLPLPPPTLPRAVNLALLPIALEAVTVTTAVQLSTTRVGTVPAQALLMTAVAATARRTALLPPPPTALRLHPVPQAPTLLTARVLLLPRAPAVKSTVGKPVAVTPALAPGD